MSLEAEEAVELFCILDQADRLEQYEKFTYHQSLVSMFAKERPRQKTPYDFGYLG